MIKEGSAVAALILSQERVPKCYPFDLLGESESAVPRYVSLSDFLTLMLCIITTGICYSLYVRLSYLIPQIPYTLSSIIFILWLQNWRFRRSLPVLGSTAGIKPQVPMASVTESSPH